MEPLDLGPGLGTVVGLLVSLVLFDGGLNLRLPGDTIRATVQRIAVLRLMISLGAGLLAAHWLAGLSWSVAAVFSAIVLATGPTVVTPLVRQIKLSPPLGDVLEDCHLFPPAHRCGRAPTATAEAARGCGRRP